MSDIGSARQKIQVEGVRFRSAVSESLAQSLGASINYLIDATDYIIDKLYPVGSIIMADLTFAQFNTQVQAFLTKNQTWIKANGQSSAGTTYETITGNSTVPDHINRYARMANNDGELRAQLADDFKAHNHDGTVTLNTGGGSNLMGTNNTNDVEQGNQKENADKSLGAVDINITINNQGGSETRPKTTKTNFFIRVD